MSNIVIITGDRSVTVVISRRLLRFGYGSDEGEKSNKILEKKTSLGNRPLARLEVWWKESMFK